MNTNRAVIIGMFIFWAVAVALMVAGLISYENQKRIDSITQDAQGNNQGSSTVKGLAGQGGSLEGGLTLSVVSQHAVESDCWMVISGSVYNVTSYIPMHPGGREIIVKYCGTNATDAFSSKDKLIAQNHSAFAYALLDKYFVGNIGDVAVNNQPAEVVGEVAAKDTSISNMTTQNETKGVDTPTPPQQVTLSLSEISTHNTSASCWLIMNSKVYDVTAYIPMHPGGSQRILNYCGSDALSAFNAAGHSTFAQNLLEKYYIGDVGTTVAAGQTSAVNVDANSSSNGTVQDVIETQFPGATIIKTESEDNGVQKIVLRYDGEKYEVLVSSDGTILRVEEDD